jgi:hypothetical protein
MATLLTGVGRVSMKDWIEAIVGALLIGQSIRRHSCLGESYATAIGGQHIPLLFNNSGGCSESCIAFIE